LDALIAFPISTAYAYAYPHHAKCVMMGARSARSIRQHTGATIVAIKREENLIVSPGPYARLLLGDHLLIIGDEAAYKRSRTFLYPLNHVMRT
jgi:K+/H+ antiporter YhaU regulatory subunit KhtT